MKKLISCLLAAAILISLAACGKDATDEKIKEVAQQIGLISTSVKTVDGVKTIVEDSYYYVNFDIENGEVKKAYCGDYVFYKDGEEKSKFYDKLLSVEDMIDYQSKVEDIVLASLTSPDTAKFPGGGLTPLEGWFFIRTGNAVKVETYVDAQNGLGVSTRNNVVAIYRDGECAKLQIGNIDIIG